MYIFLIVIHVLVCFLMVGGILLQSGKGAEIGASFGGSSQTVFGSRGPANFLSKFTVVVATIFMLTSLSLAILSQKNGLFLPRSSISTKKRHLRPLPKHQLRHRQPQLLRATLQVIHPPANTRAFLI